MQAHNNHPLFIVRPRMTRLRRHLSGRVAASLVALALSAPGWAAPRSPEQASTLPPLPQVAQDVASPSAQVRRQALRGLRERGGPETLPLLAGLLGDAEIDIREGAVAGVIGVYVQPRANRSINSAAAAFEAARFHDQPWSVPPELSTALVKALADEQPSVRRDAAYAVGIVLTPPVTDAVAFEILASLSDREPSVRVAAARALGRLRVQDAGVPLIGRVNDEDLDVRLASMCALGDLRYERAVVALTDQFTFYVRGVAGRSAISALAAIGHPSSDSTVRSADHVRVSGPPKGGVRRPGALGWRRRCGAAHRGGHGLRERHAGTHRDGFRACIGGSRWRQPSCWTL